MTWNQVLTEPQQALLGRERELLGRLQELVAELGAGEADRAALRHSILQLDQLFSLVVVGEFNAGKSAFVNALLGAKVLEEGVTPTTSCIQVVHYGETAGHQPESASRERIWADSPALRNLQIVDTPGTNAILREHEALTREFVPRSDLVLFVTSADRPFTESERSFLEKIRQWGKKILVVINKVDILETPEDVRKVKDFVRSNVGRLLETEPEVFAVSARAALRRKSEGEAVDGEFARLEEYVHDTLDEGERLRLKLSNPLGVGRDLARRLREEAEQRLELLAGDLETLREIDAQLDLYRQDMEREFRLRLADVDRLLHAFENRGVEFFDDRMRLARVFDLLNKARMKADYQSSVIADTPQQIEQCVEDLIDWMLSSEIRQWEQIRDQLQQRDRQARMAGRSAAFEQDRRRLIESVGRQAQQALEAFDREKESSRMADELQQAVAGTALMEAGAVGLGALVTAMATTTLADVTGLLAAGTVAVLGLFVIPAKRRTAKRQLRERIQTMRRDLMQGLTGHFEREQKGAASRLQQAVAPYSQFVRAEESKLSGTREQLGEWLEQADLLSREIGELR